LETKKSRRGSIPTNLFGGVARKINSRFITIAVAQHTDGEWMIVMPGDARVLGWPENADVDKFHGALKKMIGRE
jgi:hypothetical protein